MIRAFCETLPEEERTLADIGCDHGKLPLKLLREEVISFAVASDVKEGPLSRARENAALAGYEARLRFCLADGLAGLAPGEVRMAVIAGMGGETIRGILTPEETERTRVKDFFLSPQSKVPDLRAFLAEQGYRYIEERSVRDRKKEYLLLHVRRA